MEKAFQSGKTLFLYDSKIVEYEQLGIRSVVFMPILHTNAKLGMLVIHSVQEKFFTKENIAFLELFAAIASLAIVKFNFHNETKKALEIRNRFIALASHELRTPLTSINGYIQLLYGRLGNAKTIESRWIEELYNESIRLTNLVKELLDINRIKQGQFAFRLSEVDMKKVVNTVVAAYNTSERVIIFEDKTFNNRYRVVGDFDKLRQMVAALINNTIKFSNEKDKVVISLTANARNVRLRLGDGSQKSFKRPEQKIDDELEVGLVLAKHVVHYHHGKISTFSNKHKGTIVEVELPLAKN